MTDVVWMVELVVSKNFVVVVDIDRGCVVVVSSDAAVSTVLVGVVWVLESILVVVLTV